MPSEEPAPISGDPMTAVAVDAALRKAAVIWLTVAGHRPALVWPVWQDATLYVLHGGTEQQSPGLAAATADGPAGVTVAVPAKGARELRATFAAVARDVPAGSAEWERLVPLLVAKRLNLRDVATAPQRWSRECSLTAISPVTAG